MNGATDILKSERGVFVILLIVSVTVLTALGKVSANDWLDYTKWIALMFVGGKTISHAVETLKPGSPTDTTPTAQAFRKE